MLPKVEQSSRQSSTLGSEPSLEVAISRCRDIATSLGTSCGSSRLPEEVFVTENGSNKAYEEAQ